MNKTIVVGTISEKETNGKKRWNLKDLNGKYYTIWQAELLSLLKEGQTAEVELTKREYQGKDYFTIVGVQQKLNIKNETPDWEAIGLQKAATLLWAASLPTIKNSAEFNQAQEFINYAIKHIQSIGDNKNKDEEPQFEDYVPEATDGPDIPF